MSPWLFLTFINIFLFCFLQKLALKNRCLFLKEIQFNNLFNSCYNCFSYYMKLQTLEFNNFEISN